MGREIERSAAGVWLCTVCSLVFEPKFILRRTFNPIKRSNLSERQSKGQGPSPRREFSVVVTRRWGFLPTEGLL